MPNDTPRSAPVCGAKKSGMGMNVAQVRLSPRLR